MRITGKVAHTRGAGFVVARAPVDPSGGVYDASDYDGIYMRARVLEGVWAVYLWTADTRFAWQYYQAPLLSNGQWQNFEVPFGAFQSGLLGKPLDLETVKMVGLASTRVGGKLDVIADEIGFYKELKMYKELTPEEKRVIINKGTEAPFSGKYDKHYEEGVYTCKRCGAELYESTSKFKSGCGWPSFDDEIEGAIQKKPDADGVRTEILCANCGGHLGHVFTGEGLTPKNVRHCVNSISMDFIPQSERGMKRAIFASGCFWGTEFHLQKAPGVISTTVGYTGGHVANPTYKQVCTDKTGHAEAVEVVYDPHQTTYEELAKLYFETHDFTQLNRQGPDIGKQYRSEIFYTDQEQKRVAEELIKQLEEKGYDVKTAISEADRFWPAELYHQDYYKNNGKQPYCHLYRKIF